MRICEEPATFKVPVYSILILLFPLGNAASNAEALILIPCEDPVLPAIFSSRGGPSTLVVVPALFVPRIIVCAVADRILLQFVSVCIS